ncbi:MAG TPA: ABC transporter ATP-binding protein, partial [Woeseiaceae bacterium]|nr:ABC transporter ATP-binding protein [Woeseiaceae bacterium]
RVAIARALIVAPRVLVCDEAVAALDGTVRTQILALLRQLQERTGLVIVFISHDLGVVRAISHRVAVMYLGHVVEIASNEDLFRSPRHPYTRALLNAVPVADPTAQGTPQALAGEVPSILSPPTGCAFHPRCAFALSRCKSEEQELRLVGNTKVACWRSEEILP